MNIFHKLLHFFRKKTVKLITLIILAVIIFWILFSAIAQATAWKAVFLDNGQIYFGKGWWLPFTDTMSLSHVHYVRNGGANSGGTDPNATNLIVSSLKDEPQGPQPIIEVNKSHILYIQYLRSDSSLTQALILKESQIPGK